MKKKILTTAILLTSLTFAATYNYTLSINVQFSESNVGENQNNPIMQNATPQERTGIQSTGQILASDGGIDWYGEVPTSELISGQALYNYIGFNQGIVQFSNEPWLHVGIDGKELFIAKKPYARSISYGRIRDFNAMIGNHTIDINGSTYKIRLFNCAINGSIGNSGYDTVTTHGSEWNRIMYRLTNQTYNDNQNHKTSEEPFINLAYYSEDDFIFDSSGSSRNWCQEEGSSNALTRGNRGVSHVYNATRTLSSSSFVWRPVLEKVN